MEVQPSNLSYGGFLFKSFAAIGITYCAKKCFNLCSWIYKSFFLPQIDFKATYGNGWVIITGGSDGIGLAFAEQFIQRDMKICLMARNEEKLNQTINKLKEKYNKAQIKYIVFDFDKYYTNDEISQLQSKLNFELGDDISILFNNVGNVARGLLTELSNEQIRTMFNVNINTVTFITKIILEKMQKRQRSLVFFSGAVMGQMRFGTRQVYSSAKAYIESISECLSREYKNVDFTCLNIGPVESNFNRAKMPFTVQPDDFAKSAINKLGKYQYTGGCVKHDIFWFLFWNVPFLKGMIHKKMLAKPKSE